MKRGPRSDQSTQRAIDCLGSAGRLSLAASARQRNRQVDNGGRTRCDGVRMPKAFHLPTPSTGVTISVRGATMAAGRVTMRGVA